MQPIQSILIANRGEIASRIIRTCRRLGIRSIAVFSEADRQAPFVREADQAVPLGGYQADASYLDMDKILDAAHRTQANAVHPGYGFLSESALFAEKCIQAGVIFIGPRPEVIAAMGSKSKAKALVEAHGVPVIPGYKGSDQRLERFQKEAEAIGYPVLLKATAGGGGKGMRVVEKSESLAEAFAAAKREAMNSFGDDLMILEKYFEAVRHIEFQIFGDRHGNAIHLLERECSIQRRHQKVLEESPSPALDADLREKMGAAALKVCKALQYDNAGTVEFILDEAGQFYFLEVNTRLQVEHPVTEMVTGLDLVEMQIEVAEGLPLSIRQEAVKGHGYALEVRLYAEDPGNDFLPVTGTILKWAVPDMEGIRIETSVESGSEISIYYDPMIAKLIVHADDRARAFRKMAALLQNLECLGPVTNREFLLDLVRNTSVEAGDYSTRFLETWDTTPKPFGNSQLHWALTAAVLSGWYERNAQRSLLQSIPSGWRNSDYQPQQLKLQIGDEEHLFRYRFREGTFQVEVGEWQANASLNITPEGTFQIGLEGILQTVPLAWEGNTCHVQVEGLQISVVTKPRFPDRKVEAVKGGMVSPMPCQVLKLLVAKGDTVVTGDLVAVLVSMKMENSLYADTGGTVSEIYVEEGQNIEAGVLLMKLETE
ncbi:UNVERIFIED_CONTAM: hypothetical protein GTU68_012515 [Idotea baltica]|nr:hypothetical protein [Idotea baltica]